MTILLRLLLVCVFALLGMRGASACEQMTHSVHATSVAHTVHVHSRVADHSDCHHAGCCSQGCGSHCGALPLVSRVDTPMRSHDAPCLSVAALHAGITHAPLLPPPIV